MTTKKGQGPLLFIHQPFARTPSNKNMQEVFTNRQKLEPFEDEAESENKQQMIEENQGLVERIDLKPEKRSNNQLKLEKQTSVNTGHQQEKKRTSLNRVKPFKDMDLHERLEYLINFPKVLPPVPCVFYTAQMNYQGYLSKYDDQEITVQLYDKSYKTISLDELTNILMIGIKR